MSDDRPDPSQNGSSSSRGGLDDDEREVMASMGSGVERRRTVGGGPGGGIGMPTEEVADFGETMRRLWEILSTERLKLVVVLFLTIASVSMVVVGPKLLGNATDVIVEGVTSPEGIDFGALHQELLFVAGIYLLAWGFAYGQAYLLAGVVQRSMYELRESVEHKINRLPLSYIDRHARGDLLSRVTNDIDNLAQSLQQTVSQIITSFLTLVGVAVMMVVISPILAVAALVTVPVSVWAMKEIGGRARPKFLGQWRHTGDLNAQVEEAFTGHMIVKSFGRQAEVAERFRTTNDQLYDAGFAAQFTSSLIQPVMVFLGNLQYVVIAVVGGIRISSGGISVGELQAFFQYARQFSQPLTQLASMATMFQSGAASLERVIELLDAPEQTPEQVDTPNPPPVRGHVEFDDVTFAYPGAEEPVLRNVSFTAAPGTTTAIIGVTLLAAGLHGYLIAPAYLLDRAMMIGAALCLIKPGLVTDAAGAGLALGALAVQVLRRRAEPVASERS